MEKYKISIEFNNKIDPSQLLMELEDKLENFYSDNYKGSELIQIEYHCLHCDGKEDCEPFKTVDNCSGAERLSCILC